MCNLKYSITKKIPIVFLKIFILQLKKLAEEFEKQLTCSGENNEKLKNT